MLSSASGRLLYETRLKLGVRPFAVYELAGRVRPLILGRSKGVGVLMKRFSLLCLAVLVLVLPTPARAGYSRAILLFNLQDPAIAESSGVASYSRSASVLFTHNDSGDIPRFFAIGSKGETLSTYLVVGAFSADWEDMARGPGSDGDPALYFGDIGDNFVSRPFITVYEVPEPMVGPEAQTTPVPVPVGVTRRLQYEDGPRDAETLFVHPRTGALGIVSKEANGESGIYIAEPSEGAPFETLRRVATVSFRKIARPVQKSDFGPESRLQTTGGDISRDGRRIVIRTYVEAFEWNISKGLAAGLKRTPLRIPLPRTNQGEAIAYTRDGRSLVTTTEQVPAPVHLIPGT